MLTFFAFAFGYLLGSIPFGLVLVKMAGLGDIRDVGSGNIGATNVLRTGRKDLALATLLLDGGKGAIAVLLAWNLFGNHPVTLGVAGAAAFLGHCFPIWLGLKGGKGVATFLGTTLALHFLVGLITCAVWVIMAYLTRISSVSALIAALAAPVFMLVFGQYTLAIAVAFMSALIFIRHRENIGRLINNTEPRIGATKKSP